ncbi:MAG: cob(I)yrinic acid a,c-diamide adenosyltransferase [Desulfosudaceae bacterium]
MKGYVQVYTGDGKGKTTAALGLTLRAAGAGLRVYIGQFLKNGDYSEIKALQYFSELVTVAQFGMGRFVRGKPSAEEVTAAEEGLARIRAALTGGRYDLVIAEEANVAVACGLFSEKQLCDLIEARPDTVELVITGRSAPAGVLERADLVTEMKMIKHYFQKGVAARIGIEK